MKSQPNPSQDWAPVEPGDLQSLSTRLRRPVGASVVKTAGLAAAVGATLVIAVGLAMTHFGDHPAKLACYEVGPNLEAYAHGECPEPLAGQIAWHLKSCPKCRGHLEVLRKAEAQAAAPRTLPPRTTVFAAVLAAFTWSD